MVSLRFCEADIDFHEADVGLIGSVGGQEAPTFGAKDSRTTHYITYTREGLRSRPSSWASVTLEKPYDSRPLGQCMSIGKGK